VGVIGLDVGVFLGHLVVDPLPEVPGIGEDVGLAAEGELLLPVSPAAVLEGVPDAALDALAGVHRLLHGHFPRRALAQEPPAAGVEPLRVLPHDDEVDVLGALVLERRVDPGQQDHGPQVDVEVELEAHLQEDLRLEDPRPDARMADGAEQRGVHGAKLRQHGVRQKVTLGQVALPADVVTGQMEFDPLGIGNGLEGLEGLGDDFGSRAVAGQHADVVGFHALSPVCVVS